jgi:hypothetical protein
LRVATSSGPPHESTQESDQEKDQEDEKENFGDSGRGHRNASKAENRRDDCDYKESQRPSKHIEVLLFEAPVSGAWNAASFIDAGVSSNT